MAVDLSTNPGGLLRRIGKIGYVLNSLNSFLGTTDLSAASIVSVGTGIDGVETQYNASRNDLSSNLYPARETLRGSVGSYTAYLQQLAQNTVIQMVNDDTKLSSLTLSVALAELIRQMTAAAASVTRPVVSVTIAAGGSNVGTGTLIGSHLGPNGLQRDYLFAEDIKLKCTSDGQGSGTAGQETFTTTGALSQSDPLYWNWPLGSGTSTSMSAVDADLDISGGQLLQNGGFKTFTNTNAPDNWPIATGTAGTTIFQASGSNAYKGTSGLTFTGNGSELTSIQQPFSTTPSTTLGAGGSSTVIKPSTVYGINCWLKVSSVPAAGVLEIALVNGSGTITTDAAGTNNSITKSLPAATTSFVALNGFFRTPAANPSTGYKLRVRLSTALSNTVSVYVDNLALVEATQMYSGGPYLALFSGATNFLLDDTFTATVANDYSSKWAKLLERLFSLRTLGLAIPSSGSPTIADSYIG